MPSYFITGTSKGLGYAFLLKLAKDPANTVIGLARSKATLEAKLKKDGITNIHVLEGDVGDLASLKRAAEAVSKITGGKLDYLINNAAYISEESRLTTVLDYDSNPQVQTDDFIKSFQVNTIGLINTVQAFLPLVRKGTAKKVVNISTAMADLTATNDVGIDPAAPYSASKAAANVVIAKYNAALQGEGILFISICPGLVATEQNLEAPDTAKSQQLGAKYAAYAPNFKGMSTPEESVTSVLAVIADKSVEKGDGGSYVSHHGNQQWL